MEERNNRRPLYLQVKEKVLELIEEDGLGPHDPVPSEGQLAEQFDVSRTTGKLALQSLEEEGVVYRMHRRGTFVAEKNSFDQKEKWGRRNSQGSRYRDLIGLVIPEIDDYSGEIVTAAEAEGRQQNWDIIIKVAGQSLETETAVLDELVDETKVDGIILFPGDRKACGDAVLRLKLNQYPIVIIDRIFSEIEIDSVCHDHYKGSYQMTEYLIEQGHSQIGFVSVPVNMATSRQQRYQGYVQALMDHNLVTGSKRVLSDLNFELNMKKTEIQFDVLPKLEKFLKENSELTAVCCVDDYVAAHLFYAARRRGLRVPDDLSITGFANISSIARHLTVPLTTVHQPAKPLVKSVINLLIERMEDPQKPVQTIKLETEIVERKSVRSFQVV